VCVVNERQSTAARSAGGFESERKNQTPAGQEQRLPFLLCGAVSFAIVAARGFPFRPTTCQV